MKQSVFNEIISVSSTPYDLITHPMLLLDNQLRIMVATEACRNLLSSAHACTVGQRLSQPSGEHDFGRVQDKLARVVADLKPRIIEDFVAPLRKWIEFNVSPSPRGACIILADITSRKRA